MEATAGGSQERSPSSRGWIVALSGLGINLALGILYTWSVISGGVPEGWGWSETDKSLPYSIACLVFCIVMVPAGRMQDVTGPRVVAAIGGVLVGAGMILASFTTTPLGYIMGFGVLAGAGIGFGYASATPPAVKWFPKAKTGMIAGLVVSGFGLASVYAAPLSAYLIDELELPWTVRILGMAFLAVVVALAMLLRPPRKGEEPKAETSASGRVVVAGPGAGALDMLKTPQFYLLWFTFACGAGAGLMIISKLKAIATTQAGVTLGFLFVAALAVGNGGGRILAGTLSDKLGRKLTLFLCFAFQAVCILMLSQARTGTFLAHAGVLGVLSALIGAMYGANLALFPSITKDYWGLKNFGLNYGLVFTAWGVGGFVLALVAGRVYDAYKTFSVAYYFASGLLVAAALVTLLIRPVKAEDAAEPVPAGEPAKAEA